jgi:hypothetical protein
VKIAAVWGIVLIGSGLAYLIIFRKPPISVDAGGPYLIRGGEDLTLGGTGQGVGTEGQYGWDLNGDGQFDDATGLTPTVTWSDLLSLGLGRDGQYPIALQVRESDGRAATAKTLLGISGAKSTADAGGPYTIRAGEKLSLRGSDSRPNSAGRLIYAWDLDNDGQYDDATGQTPSVNWADLESLGLDEGMHLLALKVTGSDGLTATGTAQLAIKSLEATADAGGNYSIREGEELSLGGSDSRASSAGRLDYDWDLNGDGTYDVTGAAATVSWSTLESLGVNDDGTRTIMLRVSDDNNVSSTDTAELEIVNAPPTAEAGDGYQITEGDDLVLRGSGSDPSAADGLTYAWDLDNDGQYDDASGNAATITSSSLANLGIQAAGSYTIGLRVSDDDGGEATDTSTLYIGVSALQVPFITWGGDMATFYGNGGLETKPGSIFDTLGLNIKLVNGDDFDGQVKDYVAGKTHFLRGTFSMLGLESERINSDPKNQAVVFLQLTWSAGDHMVAREGVTLDAFKGNKVAIQRGGPHVGMLNDALRTAGLGWDDIQVQWVKDLSGPNGPAALFRNDSSVHACMVISPDMAALTGGVEPNYDLDSIGDGLGDSVKGARVLVSTAQMSRSICDVYACRKRFYEENRGIVERFTAGYLRACEKVFPLRGDYDPDTRQPKEFDDLLGLSVQIFGEDVIPSKEDAYGLILDCSFVQLPGNTSFFTNDSNLSGFQFKHETVLDLAVKELKTADARRPFLKPDFNYDEIKRIGNLRYPTKTRPRTIGDFKVPETLEELEKVTLYKFSIGFEPDRVDFPPAEYGDLFQRAIDQATLWGRAGMLVRGHACPGTTLAAFVGAGMDNDDIERTGMSGNWQYVWTPTGEDLDLADTPRVIELISEAAQRKPRDYARADFLVNELKNLSEERARNVRRECVDYARSKKVDLDESQIKAVGVGVVEPVVAKPRKEDQAKNTRVEFRLIKVPIETVSEFDF